MRLLSKWLLVDLLVVFDSQADKYKMLSTIRMKTLCAWADWNYCKSYFVLYLLVSKLCHKFTHVMIQLSKALTRPSSVKFTIFQWWPPPLPPDTVWDTRRENRRQKNVFFFSEKIYFKSWKWRETSRKYGQKKCKKEARYFVLRMF